MRKIGMRALVVEANQQLSKALKLGLEHAGFTVDLAGDAAEADCQARAATYDMILLDLLLPKSDGLTLLREHGCGVLVAMGGGSAIDCAKRIALLAANGDAVRDYCGFERYSVG